MYKSKLAGISSEFLLVSGEIVTYKGGFMYVLIRIKYSVVLEKVRKYLGLLGVWIKEFNEPEYCVDVTAEEREQFLHNRNCDGSLNPPNAWKTCSSLVQIWDWDNLGRGPYPARESILEKKNDPAPSGKGWVIEKGKRIRVAGECAAPRSLNYITCYKWCTRYEPTSIDATVFVAEQVIAEHERRAKMLRSQIEYLKQTDLDYRQAIKTGGVFEYKNGKFVITTFDK